MIAERATRPTSSLQRRRIPNSCYTRTKKCSSQCLHRRRNALDERDSDLSAGTPGGAPENVSKLLDPAEYEGSGDLEDSELSRKRRIWLLPKCQLRLAARRLPLIC